jgi:hypothetical protein
MVSEVTAMSKGAKSVDERGLLGDRANADHEPENSRSVMLNSCNEWRNDSISSGKISTSLSGRLCLVSYCVSADIGASSAEVIRWAEAAGDKSIRSYDQLLVQGHELDEQWAHTT